MLSSRQTFTSILQLSRGTNRFSLCCTHPEESNPRLPSIRVLRPYTCRPSKSKCPCSKASSESRKTSPYLSQKWEPVSERCWGQHGRSPLRGSYNTRRATRRFAIRLLRCQLNGN